MANENNLDENMELAPATPQQIQEESSIVESSAQKMQLAQATTAELVANFEDESLRNAGSICRSNPHLQRAYKTLFKIMKYAAEHKASDIFIAPGFPPAVKINGTIIPIAEKPFSQENT
ncbi:MAG: hypothetical protein IKG79_00530, partial [Neisseriaceae bacterium]|nr:hypothetical protein [Neisseriaceae bacterium]